jgi:hypothetical protein
VSSAAENPTLTESETPWVDEVEDAPMLPAPEEPARTARDEIQDDTTRQEEIGASTDSAAPLTAADASAEPAQDLTATPDSPAAASEALRPAALTGPLQLREAPGLQTRGVFVILTAFASAGCLLGFIVSGTSSLPSAAGWGLVLGSWLSALLSPARLGWTAAWMPPLAITAVILVFGQATFIGAMPTIARELAMVASNLTALAPAQLISVVGAAIILWLKRRSVSS